MPIELESGKLLLTSEEIQYYQSAATYLLQKLDTLVQMNAPITREDFVKLHLTNCFLNGQMEFLDEVEAITKEEITRRKNQH